MIQQYENDIDLKIKQHFKNYIKDNLPSTFRLTVHTAVGLPGNSETAISPTSNPFRKTLSVERGPRPQIA